MAVATIEISQETVKTDKGAVKLTITAAGTNITSAVFAIEVLPRSSDSLDPLYRFSHVCSPSELVEFPDYEPEDECYFRTDCIEMIFDTVDIAIRTNLVTLSDDAKYEDKTMIDYSSGEITTTESRELMKFINEKYYFCISSVVC